MDRSLRRIALLVICVLSLSITSSSALAAPRTGSISIPGGAPLTGGGPADDITAASATFAPETGQLEATITLAAAPVPGENGSVTVYYRSDSSGQCNKGINDAQLFAILDPTNELAVVTVPVGKGNVNGTKTTSGNTLTLKGQSPNLIGIDYQCVFISVAATPTPFDTTLFYFTGFGPPPPAPVITPAPIVTPETNIETKPKKLTKKQILSRELKKCKRIKNKSKRSKCVKTAEKRYGPKKRK